MSELKKSKVNGGTVVREARSGRFVSVQSAGKVYKSGPKSMSATKQVTAKRSGALKRLADR